MLRKKKNTKLLGQSRFLTSQVAIFVMLGNPFHFTGLKRSSLIEKKDKKNVIYMT